MNTLQQYDGACLAMSGRVVSRYSTNFSLGIRALHPRFRPSIKAIYAFVRFADEIVDTFHAHDKPALLARFSRDTHEALSERISLNPVLHAFQLVAHRHGIGPALIAPFLSSMSMDLARQAHGADSFAQYVHGSAEVVGLMCLRVFCEGDEGKYTALAPAAKRLGAAFQKVNFLRDMREDHAVLGRSYFPGLGGAQLSEAAKRAIEADLGADFQAGLAGIRSLPCEARLGVYLAYSFYHALFRKIQGVPAEEVRQRRIRIPGHAKLGVLASGYVRYRLDRL